MDLPKYHETFLPILKILSTTGAIRSRELALKVRDSYYSYLPKELLNEKTRSGANTLIDRILWGKSYLKMGKYVSYPKRGLVQIEPKGQEVLTSGQLLLSDLQNDPDFLQYRSSRHTKAAKGEVSQIEDDSPLALIEKGCGTLELEVKIELLDVLKTLDPYLFEKIILKLLKAMGYGDFIETAKSGDGGIDGIINEDQLGLGKIYTQAKRYTESKVREKDIRNFIGAMSGDTSKGVFITTSTFDHAAKQKAREAHHSIRLIDGSELVDLMYQYEVGVQVKDTYFVKEINSSFFEEN